MNLEKKQDGNFIPSQLTSKGKRRVNPDEVSRGNYSVSSEMR